MDEKLTPKSIKSRADLKSLTFQSLYTIIDSIKSGNIQDVSVGDDTCVSILTTYGIVMGTMVQFSDPEESDNNETASEMVTKLIYELVFKGRNSEIIKRESEDPSFHLINDASAVLLKDVTIKPYASLNDRINLAFMILFTDEIKGLSFGEFS